jgi:polysaccharide biosynthesis protein PslG
MLRRLATCSLFSLAVWAGVAMGAAAAQARVPASFLGVYSDDLLEAAPPARSTALRDQANIGVGVLRYTFDWQRIETSPDHYDLAPYDALVGDAAARGIRVLPVLFGAPRFRSSRPTHGARRGAYPPKHYDEMARFAAVLVRRYGPAGTLWQERPELHRLPIRSWQVWNEPNLRVYWASGPSPRRYVRLLSTVGKAIKRRDRHAEIVTAGLPQSRQGIDFESFVAGLYRAHGRRAFDTLAVHPYARGYRGAIGAAKLARRLMNRYHDRRARIWVTELGWASGGPKSSFRAGEQGQATRIRDALLGLAARRRRLHLRGVVYHKWRDTRLHEGVHDFWGLHTGLLRAGGGRKPAFRAFRRAARSLLD